MTSTIALNSNIMKTTNSTTSTRKQSLHFTPIVPKRKLSVNSNINSVSTGNNNNYSITSSSKRYNKANTSSNNNSNFNTTSTIKTSKRWVLPPRPRPGRKTFFNNNNNINANSMSSASSIISSTSSSSSSSPVSIQSSNSATSTIFSNGNKRRNQSVPTIPNVKREHNNNTNILNKSNLSKKNSSNYLAFLKFDDETSTLNLPLIDEHNKQHSILSSLSSQNEHAITPTNSNSSTIVPTTSGKKSVNSIPRDISPSDTIVATPTNEKCISLNKLQNFTYNYNNNNLLPDFNLDYNYNISSTSLISSFASNLPHHNQSTNKTATVSTNNDDFMERTTNDELENEIYNNIWKFLPRYNKALDNDKNSSNNTNVNDNVASDNNNDDAATATNAGENDSYFYSAPTLEELMDEQDNTFSSFNNFNFTLQDLQ
ncbi:hypothetical protein MOUN0_D03994 [Monosporozyma unispora]|nr:mitotic spindle checkpoint protein Bub3 [Kazachstania unispora]